VVENTFGSGRTLLVGTHPGVGYFNGSDPANRQYFADVFAWTGKSQHIRLSNNAMQARLHHGEIGNVLWIVNATREPQSAKLTFGAQHGALALGDAYWANEDAKAAGSEITVPPRDVMVVRLGGR